MLLRLLQGQNRKMSKQPPNSNWKKVKVLGGTISYQGGKEMDEVVRDLNDRLKERLKDREAKAAERAGKAPPDLTPRPYLVAFIDILGFGNEIQCAETDQDLQKAYAKIRLVQKEFQQPSAADDPDEQSDLNLDSGRRVIALSDAVVVAITPNCPTGPVMGPHDLFGFAIYELMLAQAICAASHGIFVRGGISHGSFFFEDGVLLSPALARAYELESKYADYPLIVISESTRRAILSVSNADYEPGDDPTQRLFAKHGRRKWKGEQLYFLDYMNEMREESHRGWMPEDRRDYLDAKERGDEQRMLAAIERRDLKDAAYFLEGHRRRLEEAYHASLTERVRKKYRWLMKYHNRSFRNDLEYIRDQVIDLSKFQLPSK